MAAGRYGFGSHRGLHPPVGGHRVPPGTTVTCTPGERGRRAGVRAVRGGPDHRVALRGRPLLGGRLRGLRGPMVVWKPTATGPPRPGGPHAGPSRRGRRRAVWGRAGGPSTGSCARSPTTSTPTPGTPTGGSAASGGPDRRAGAVIKYLGSKRRLVPPSAPWRRPRGPERRRPVQRHHPGGPGLEGPVWRSRRSTPPGPPTSWPAATSPPTPRTELAPPCGRRGGVLNGLPGRPGLRDRDVLRGPRYFRPENGAASTPCATIEAGAPAPSSGRCC